MATITGAKTNKRAIIWRIDGIPNPPPEMVMLINPENLDIAYNQIINETRTLGGFAEEHWGEQLSSISSSGRTAMFYSSGGLTRLDAKSSAGYENFSRMLDIYRSNGKGYDTKKVHNPNTITVFGTIAMSYMNKEYQGYFDGFTVKENADKQFYLEYDFTFKVTRLLGNLVIQAQNYTLDIVK